jgi:DNA/RNA-binding domain of Phe-tRNA-synthetase-like protein
MAAETFTIAPQLFDAIAGLRVGVVVARDIDNTRSLDLSAQFDQVHADTQEAFEGIELAGYPLVRAWRDVYKGFGEKRNRSSVESLICRALNGKPVSSINPLVDIYNLLSLAHRFPYGGENLDVLDTDIELTYADGTEEFVPLGTDTYEATHPRSGEVVYRSGTTVLCGCFNYRESDITKITPDTRNVVLFIEDVAGTGHTTGELACATEALAAAIGQYLGTDTTVITTAILDENKACCNLVP